MDKTRLNMGSSNPLPVHSLQSLLRNHLYTVSSVAGAQPKGQLESFAWHL